eukprot:2538378-Amphidinium_carterae.1
MSTHYTATAAFPLHVGDISGHSIGTHVGQRAQPSRLASPSRKHWLQDQSTRGCTYTETCGFEVSTSTDWQQLTSTAINWTRWIEVQKTAFSPQKNQVIRSKTTSHDLYLWLALRGPCRERSERLQLGALAVEPQEAAARDALMHANRQKCVVANAHLKFNFT